MQHGPGELRPIEPQPPLHVVEARPYGLKREAGLFDFRSVFGRAGEHHVDTLGVQRQADGHERVQIAQRSHSGEDDPWTGCLNDSSQDQIIYPVSAVVGKPVKYPGLLYDSGLSWDSSIVVHMW